MTSRVQNARSSVTTQRPPNTRPVGEFYVNFADNQLGVIDPTPTARDLLPVRFHAATASYATAAIVQQAGGLYQAKAAIPPRVFTIADWDQFLTTAQNDNRYLRLSGGTLTGLLTLSGPPIAALHAASKAYVDTAPYLPLAGGTLTGLLTLSGPPTANLHAATKAYVDTTAGNYLPLTGGTLTGNITAPAFRFATGGGYIQSSSSLTQFVMDGSLWCLEYTRAGAGGGTLQYIRGYDSTALFTISPIGDTMSFGNVYGGGANGANPFGLTSDASGRYHIYSSNWYWSYNTASGSLDWITPQGAIVRLEASTRNFIAYVNGFKPGGGPWADTSDARIKTVAGDYTHGLAEIRQLRPRRYTYKGNDGDAHAHAAENATEFIGLIAQEAELVMPEMVSQTSGMIDDNPVTDMRTLDATALPYALVNAIKTLDQRVTLLENPAP